MIVYHILLVSFYEQVYQNASQAPGVAIPSPTSPTSSLKMFVTAADSEMASSTFGEIEIPSSDKTSAWATSSTKADAGSMGETQQKSSVIGTSSALDQHTEARVALTNPEVDLPTVPTVLNNEKEEEVHQLKQGQEKSSKEDRKMTMPKLTHKSRRSPQILAKSKTAEFKLEAKLQQAELALIESQNQSDLCKRPLDVLTYTYIV